MVAQDIFSIETKISLFFQAFKRLILFSAASTLAIRRWQARPAIKYRKQAPEDMQHCQMA